MKSVKLKNFIVGIIVGAVLTSTTSVMANSETITAFFSNMNFVVNGEKADLTERPLKKNGISYLPVRAVAEMLGYEVDYDKKTDTAILTKLNDETPPNTEEKPSDKGDGVVVSDLISPYIVDGKINLDKVKTAIENKSIGVNDKDKITGETLLIRAAKDDAYFVVKYLAGQGVDINLQDNDGKTPLHYAIINNSSSVSSELLNTLKAKTKIKDNDGKMPIDYTEKYSQMYRILNARDE